MIVKGMLNMASKFGPYFYPAFSPAGLSADTMLATNKPQILNTCSNSTYPYPNPKSRWVSVGNILIGELKEKGLHKPAAKAHSLSTQTPYLPSMAGHPNIPYRFQTLPRPDRGATYFEEA